MRSEAQAEVINGVVLPRALPWAGAELVEGWERHELGVRSAECGMKLEPPYVGCYGEDLTGELDVVKLRA